MKYSLKAALLVETVDNMKEHPLWVALSAQASRSKASSWSGILFIDHPEGCSSEMHMSLNDEEHPGGIWIDKLDVVNTKTREPDPECFRKGYAKEALALLAQAADQTETHLALIAASEPYLRRQNPDIDFPDKDELAQLYARYGFVEEYSNFAQVGMVRVPKTS